LPPRALVSAAAMASGLPAPQAYASVAPSVADAKHARRFVASAEPNANGAAFWGADGSPLGLRVYRRVRGADGVELRLPADLLYVPQAATAASRRGDLWRAATGKGGQVGASSAPSDPPSGWYVAVEEGDVLEFGVVVRRQAACALMPVAVPPDCPVPAATSGPVEIGAVVQVDGEPLGETYYLGDASAPVLSVDDEEGGGDELGFHGWRKERCNSACPLEAVYHQMVVKTVAALPEPTRNPPAGTADDARRDDGSTVGSIRLSATLVCRIERQVREYAPPWRRPRLDPKAVAEQPLCVTAGAPKLADGSGPLLVPAALRPQRRQSTSRSKRPYWMVTAVMAKSLVNDLDGWGVTVRYRPPSFFHAAGFRDAGERRVVFPTNAALGLSPLAAPPAAPAAPDADVTFVRLTCSDRSAPERRPREEPLVDELHAQQFGVTAKRDGGGPAVGDASPGGGADDRGDHKTHPKDEGGWHWWWRPRTT